MPAAAREPMWPIGHRRCAKTAPLCLKQVTSDATGGIACSSSGRLPLGADVGSLQRRARAGRGKNPRGLTSNRHAGRPGRQAVRAFAFLAEIASSLERTAHTVVLRASAHHQRNTGGHHAKLDGCSACSLQRPWRPLLRRHRKPTNPGSGPQRRNACAAARHDIPWFDLLGALGLLGLSGLKKEHGDDSYHPRLGRLSCEQVGREQMRKMTSLHRWPRAAGGRRLPWPRTTPLRKMPVETT